MACLDDQEHVSTMNYSEATQIDLAAELASAAIELSGILPQDGALDWELCLRHIGRLKDVAEQRSNSALSASCCRLIENLPGLETTAAARILLEQWVDRVLTYVANDESPAAGSEILQLQVDTRWPRPVAESDLGAFAGWLGDPGGDASGAGSSTIAEVADSTIGSAEDEASGAMPAPTTPFESLLVRAEARDDCGLLDVVMRLQANQELIDGSEVAGELATLLSAAAAIVERMLDDTAESGASQLLLDLLSDPRLPDPLGALDRDLLAEMFAAHDSQPSSLPAEADEAIGEPAATEDGPAAVGAHAVEEVAGGECIPSSLLNALAIEMPAFHEALREALDEAADEAAEVHVRRTGVDHYREQLARLALTAETVGLRSLKRVVAELSATLQALERGVVSPAQREALLPLAGAIGSYLATPNDLSACQGLTDILANGALPQPCSAAEVLVLAHALGAVQVVDDADEQPERLREAGSADVDLSIPNDLNPELLDGMLQELPVHCADFSGAIQRIVDGNGTLADVDTAKRAAHTLKGAANTVGIRGIATLTHQLEDVLVALSERQRLPRGRLATMLMEAADCLEAMGEAVLGSGPAPDNAIGALQEVLDWAHRFDRDEVGEGDCAAAIRDGQTAADAPVEHEPRAGGAAGLAAMRVPVAAVEDMLRLVSESIIASSQVRERLRGVVAQMAMLRGQHRLFVQLAAELDQLVDLRAVVVPEVDSSQQEDFDPLEFEHFSELHTVSRQLIEAATDAQELRDGIDGSLQELDDLIEVQDRLHRDNQDVVLRTRLVPVATIVSRLQRSVRQASRLLDKDVTLQVDGERTLIDGTILNNLADPLMHLLRNAVDHGVEMPAARQAANKAPTGTITLGFAREGNFIVIRCQDDGAGLDLASVRATAVERGLIAPDQVLSEDEQARLVLLPGFSTRVQATQMSGRGVGLDVVNTAVLGMKGSVSLRTTRGQGLLVELRLPAVLSSTHAFVIRLRETLTAVSGHGVEDLQYVLPEQVREVAGEVSCQLAHAIYPLKDLGKLLDQPDDRRAGGRGGFPALIVRDDAGNRQAIRVQDILASREFVIKTPGRYTPKVPGVIGMTIMGDGRVAPVIDLPELLRSRTSLVGGGEASRVPRGSEPSRERGLSHTALVVDDSLSARRATAQVLKDAGYEVRTAIDGMEAVGVLDKWVPTVLVTDLEMPRMNGFELISHVRARDSLRKLPVVMITSRSTDKHRRQAQAAGVDAYLTKPFSDDQLLSEIARLTSSHA